MNLCIQSEHAVCWLEGSPPGMLDNCSIQPLLLTAWLCFLLRRVQVYCVQERVSEKNPVSSLWKSPFWPIFSLADVTAWLNLVRVLVRVKSQVSSNFQLHQCHKHRLSRVEKNRPTIFSTTTIYNYLSGLHPFADFNAF